VRTIATIGWGRVRTMATGQWVELRADKDATTWGQMRAGQRTKMWPYDNPGDMGAGCSPDNGNERVGLRADEGNGGWVCMCKRATSRWVRMPTKVTGGLSRVPTKTTCIKHVGVLPSTDKRCLGWA
jgi:hypothetical protein